MKNLNFKVSSIKREDCADWLLNKHYAKRMCSISYCFGLFNDRKILVGVVTFGMPPSSTLAASICGEDLKDNVLELNRLVVNDNLPKNTLSYFVSKAIKKLPNDKIIVSFADLNMGHHGYIYQATNFIYTGVSSNTHKLIDKFGKEFHFRNIGHYQKNNKLKVRLVKRRINEDKINKKDIAKYLRGKKGGFTNKMISNLLGTPVSTVEHWFRLDGGFSFPSLEDWVALKKVLKLGDEYDDIMLNYEMIPCAKEIIKKLELKKVEILPKHRYIYIKGSKYFKKRCFKSLKLEKLNYPKGKNERYNSIYTPTIQGSLF